MKRPTSRQVLRTAVSLAVLVLIFSYVFRQFADASDVWEAIRTLTASDVALLLVATVWNLLTYWLLIVAATPGLTVTQAAVSNQATTAVANTVPAGGAIALGLTYTILSSWGFSKTRITLSVVAGGIWNNFVKLGMPVFALALLGLVGQHTAEEQTLAIVGLAILAGAVAVFALILRSDTLAHRIGDTGARWVSKLLGVFRRGPVQGWGDAAAGLRSQIIGLVRNRWIHLTVAAVVSHLSLFLVLLVSLRVMGVSADEVGWTQALVVFAFARLATAIKITPGGVGVVELAMIAGLTAVGGNDAEVVAAVLVFRFLTYVVPIPLGGIAYLWWRSNRSWLGSAPPLPASYGDVDAIADA